MPSLPTKRQARDLATITAALEEAIEYFDQRADAEYFTDSASPVGNEEMSHLVALKDALARVKRMGDAS